MSDKYKAFYDTQVRLLSENDPVGLIEQQYTADAQLITYTDVIVGTDALTEYFKAYIASLGYIKLISTDNFTTTDNSIMFEATMETAAGVAKVYDVWVMRDDKIYQHFTGLISFTPHAKTE